MEAVRKGYQRTRIGEPGISTERGGASITITDPSGTVSTKCFDSVGAALFEESTIWMVYAGPHIFTSEEDVSGESICMSGM